MSNIKVLMNGIIKENPTFVLLLGMCPTLGTTSSAINGMSMGLATTAVLVFSNLIISMIKNLIPDMVRIPSFIVVIASLVTILQMLLQAYVPSVYESLGLFIPLIVVNCIILGRAEAFAAKNGPVSSIFDGIGMGIGFTIGLTLLGATRELLGTGRIFSLEVFPENYGASELAGQLGTVSAQKLIVGVIVGTNGVVISPLSTVGGIAVGSAPEAVDKVKLYNELLLSAIAFILLNAIASALGLFVIFG